MPRTEVPFTVVVTNESLELRMGERVFLRLERSQHNPNYVELCRLPARLHQSDLTILAEWANRAEIVPYKTREIGHGG